MKVILLSLCCLLCSSFSALSSDDPKKDGVKGDDVKKVIARTSDVNTSNIKLIKIESPNTEFEHYVKNGTLYIKGSDNIALSRGYYDFVKQNGYGINSWSGSNIEVPDKMPDTAPRKVVSPFENHYYFNVVTYGYSMPYWDWARWEQEIDWMALHGINMPLALIGYESILARVWRKLGLTDDEINGYFCGPAHLPWMRMGNISNIDGPLNEQWYGDQIELQHKILARMKSLDMKPITMGFPGFVPKELKRLYPDLELIETSWAGVFHNWMIPPTDSLYSVIASAFIEEWEREFGKNGHYLVDSFNEMEIPFPAKGTPQRYELLASYGDIVYSAIKAVNPDAVWVMQGWMFGYQREIWDYKTLGALVSKVPNDKMILLDLAVDYNRHFWKSESNWDYHKGLHGKQWVYSVIPNMGGKVGLTGVLDFYANGHLEALDSPSRGALIGHGCAPEGIENNEIIYELFTDAGWSGDSIDVGEWYVGYIENRYGNADVNIANSLKLLQQSVYGTFTDHPRYNWQFRPGRINRGSININDAFFEGIEQFVVAAPEFEGNELYEADLAEYMALYLGGKAELLVNLIDQEYLFGDEERAAQYEVRFEGLLLAMDSLLRNHPTLNLSRWLDFAERSGKTEAQKLQYLQNAKRIITIWGPPVDDYSARVWGGLIGEYYLPRWKHYFAAKKSGATFDFASWEGNWVENHVTNHAKPDIDVIEMSTRLLAATDDINRGLILNSDPNAIGYWHLGDGSESELSFQISAAQLPKLREIRVSSVRQSGAVTVEGYEIIADGRVVASSSEKRVVTANSPAKYSVEALSLTGANNGVVLRLKLKSAPHSTAAGVVSL